jgi:hypothetical protein
VKTLDPQGGPVDLSPDGTHFRVSLTKAVAIIAALVGGAYMAGQATSGIRADLAEHKANALVHLDPAFVFKHGVPVGAWDLDASNKALAASITELHAQTKELQEWRDKQDLVAEARKPRWHP